MYEGLKATATGNRYVRDKVLPDVRSPVAVVIYTDTHTYKQKVLLYSKFMFNSKATANGNRHVREYLNSHEHSSHKHDFAKA